MDIVTHRLNQRRGGQIEYFRIHYQKKKCREKRKKEVGTVAKICQKRYSLLSIFDLDQHELESRQVILTWG